MQDVLSTRLSIRKRGGSLGHHQAIEKEERFSNWRHELVGNLVWTLGAMAAEHVFYGENSAGVGGDVESATSTRRVDGRHVRDGPRADQPQRAPLCHRGAARGGRGALHEALRAHRPADHEPRGGDDASQATRSPRSCRIPAKREAAAQILGQAYITAVCLVRHNREQVAQIAEVLVQRKELHGDEVVDVLDAAQLEPPVIDVNDESIWPKL